MNHGLVLLKFCRQHIYTIMIPAIWVEERACLIGLNRKTGHCLEVFPKEAHLIVSTTFLEMLQWGHSCTLIHEAPLSISMPLPGLNQSLIIFNSSLVHECLVKDRFSIIISTLVSTVLYLCLEIYIIWILLAKPGQKATYYLRKLNWRMGHCRYHWGN